jgi:CPA2 family monovalent cation:H+ antiporter-2
MAGSINITAYSDALVILGTAGVVVPLVRRFGMSSVLGYLGAGALLGPLALGSLKEQVPILWWFTIVDPASISGIAELGVVFLLFLIGLELSLARLLTMRRLVFGLGAAQVLASTVVIAAILAMMGLSGASAVVIGACLALSSTAIVIEILSEQGRMATSTGRTSFSVLLAQDLAVVPILLIISVLAARSGSSVWISVTVALAQAVLAVSVIVLIARAGLRPLFRLVAQAQSTELFMATTLFVIVGTSVLAALAGLSMALGAFVAGLLLAETEYRKAIQTHIEPFKGLLLGVFFFTVGMGIDLGAILRNPLIIAGAVLALIALKAGIIYLLATRFRVSRLPALETAMLLGPGGEFAFVGIGAALYAGVVAKAEADFALVVTSLSMVLVPALASIARRIEAWQTAQKPLDEALLAQPEARGGHAIVVGHGRVGQVVCAMLRNHNIDYTATDSDPLAVTRERKRGAAVFYGNATNPAYLKALGLMEARAVIITIHTAGTIDEIVRIVREMRPDIPIVSRARDAQHAAHLYRIGVTDAVPETIEASLQLSEAALVGLEVPMGLVIASIHEKRDEFRHDLQAAAWSAGREGSRGVKAKG